jgi:signal transduction histidine kinase
MLSVRARILATAAVLTGLTLVAASLLLVAALDHSLTVSSDRASRARADELAALAGRGALPARLGDAGDGVLQVVASSGRVLGASDNVGGRPAITAFRPSGGSTGVVTVRGAPDDNGTEDYRVWARSVRTPDGPATVYAGDSLESVQEATATLRRALAVGVPGTEVALVVVLWFLLGRALRPVEEIRAEVAEITEHRLGRRVPEPRTDDEVGRLARTMNDMLDRLDRARRRERDFVADASHELLSPLAASRSILEVGPGRTENWDTVVPDLLEENATMERIVRDLLFLAREQPAAPPAVVPFDLDDVVLEEVARLRVVATPRVDSSAVSAGPVAGDREEVRRAVRNLLENAARHALTEVRVALRTEGSLVRLDVRDDGPGVDPAVGDRVFERFFRADPARARSGGVGLGLAIARSVAERHGGCLELAPADRGAHFVLSLPVDHPVPGTGAGGQPCRPSQDQRGTVKPAGTSSADW